MKKESKISKFIYVFLLIIALCVIIYGIINLYTEVQEYQDIDNTYDDIIENNTTTDDNDVFSVDFDKLNSINSDIVAWIVIPNTNISYPVVQGENNTTYLHHDFYKNYSKGGCPFVDANIENPFNNLNTIVYGHNLNNGSMFSNLTKYSSEEYKNEHDTVYVYLKNGEVQEYKIFAFYQTNANNSNIYNTNVEDLEEYYSYIDKYNQYQNVDVETTNSVLTLSTCTNRNRQKRYIVQAYLISDN